MLEILRFRLSQLDLSKAHYWLRLFVFLSCYWFGLYFLKVAVFNLTEVFLGSALLATMIFFASSPMQPGQPESANNVWELLRVLLVEKRGVLLSFLAVIAVTLLSAWRVTEGKISVEYSGSAGFLAKFQGTAIYYEPISPYGWNLTGLKVGRGESFLVTVSGTVSPGYLRNLSVLEENLRMIREGDGPLQDESNLQWPFSGPEGYPISWYRTSSLFRPPVLADHPTYREEGALARDTGLTIQGMPHNRVVGIILPEGEQPRRARRIIQKDDLGPNYRFPDDLETEGGVGLLDLSAKREEYPLKRTANRSGVLWVIINDSDLARWDNAGMFFLRIEK